MRKARDDAIEGIRLVLSNRRNMSESLGYFITKAMNTHRPILPNLLIASVLFVLSLAYAEPAAAELDPNTTAYDYTYSCWPNGWRKNVTDDSPDIFGIETSHYGFTLDVADFRQVRLGLLNNPAGYEQALDHKAEKLRTLPPAELWIELEVDRVSYRATTCKAGLDQGIQRLSSARLWESGRYVQHYDFQGLEFRNASDDKLDCDATLDLVVWPGSLTLTLNISSGRSYQQATLRLGLKSDAGHWQEELPIKEPWKSEQQKSLTLTCAITPAGNVESTNPISVQTKGGQRIPVRFDAAKNCYVAEVKDLKRSWRTGYTDIRDYDEFKLTVTGAGKAGAVPFLLDMRPPANITGLCPILCDEAGRPTGIPVQLSKNWHNREMGSYLMAYTVLPAEKTTTYTLRLVYGFYGTLPSASHAQLSLIGYSDRGNGRWDQLAIGCWGETICFDMDMSLVDVAITDIRMLMTRQGRDGQKWKWTDAGWGGDWLNLKDATQEKYFWTDLKTAYLAQGPCLTDVRYEGYCGANREVDFKSRVQTLRTDDHNRSFQTFTYTFTREVSVRRIWLFKLGRTHHYHSPKVAYGNAAGLLAEMAAPNTLKAGDLVVDNVTLTGAAPHWVAFPGAASTRDDKPNGYRALVVRRYQVVAGGRTYTNPTLSAPVYKAEPANLDVELLPPPGVREFRKGDRIELDLELITLPREANDYYGPNVAFRKHLAENPNSWKTTHREAIGNNLTVTVAGGRMLQNYPLVIQAEKPDILVTIKGGVGAVPIRFEGLKTHHNYGLYQVIDGRQVELDQSVHGHDYWQTDYDAATQTYKMSFNLPLDGLEESQWILTQQ